MNPPRFPPSVLVAVLSLGLLAAHAVAAELSLDDLPSYKPQQQVSGTIRVCGHGFKGQMIERWQALFPKSQPGIRFETNLQGTATAIPTVAIGMADIALIGREITHLEVLAFWRGKHRVPGNVRITSGTFTVHGDASAPGIYVHRSNPVNSLTMEQLDAILGTQRLRGAPKNLRRWGDLGLTHDWAEATINIYGNWLDDGESEFIRQTVMLNSNRWNAENYHEFWNDIERPDGTTLVDAGRNWLTDKMVLGKILKLSGEKAIEALAQDPFGLAIASARAAEHDERVKLLALAPSGRPAVLPTARTVFDGSYPLGRCTNAYFDTAPDGTVEPKLREFLFFILSREGQQVVAEVDSMPLNAAFIQTERARLK